MRVPTGDELRAAFRPLHALIDSAGEPVTLLVRNAAGAFDPVGPVQAKLGGFQAQEIIPGGPAKLGDIRLIVRAGALPAGLRRLESKDRVQLRGRDYAIVNWDDTTHAVGGEVMAIEIWARG